MIHFFLAVLSCLCASIFASQKDYIPVWKQSETEKNPLLDPYGHGSYLDSRFTPLINPSLVKIVVEVGSRDALDAISLSHYYKTHTYAFECNPQAIDICKHNIGSNPNVTLVEKAAWNTSCRLPFYPTVLSNDHINLGASSLFQLNPILFPTYQQGAIFVDAIRLDEWMEQNKISHIDLLCIDAQGATLPILQSLGSSLSKVKYVIAEAEIAKFYLEEALYPEIEAFMISQGFTPSAQLHFGSYMDVLFINNELLH